MAERPDSSKESDDGKANGKARAGRNGFDPKLVQDICRRIENVQADIDKVNAEAKEKTAPMREDIKEIKKEAVDADIPRLALNAALRKRRLEQKISGIEKGLTEPVQEDYRQLLFALDFDTSFKEDPPKRGRGRPRKTPPPDTETDAAETAEETAEAET